MVRMMIDFTLFSIPGSALCDADSKQELKSVSGCGMQDWVARRERTPFQIRCAKKHCVRR
jgi:hypothetical protein